jgi:hypothetical protein
MDNQEDNEPFSDNEALDRAMREAARDALVEHKLRGVPIVIEQNGTIIWIPAEEIVIPELD